MRDKKNYAPTIPVLLFKPNVCIYSPSSTTANRTTNQPTLHKHDNNKNKIRKKEKYQKTNKTRTKTKETL
jgi:hypothetical protein